MNSRDHSDMPPAPSYPSPNAAQMGQGMQYYSNRQLTEDELLSAELSRDASNSALHHDSSNGVHQGQSMVLGSGGADMGRPTSADQHHGDHMLPFTPNQQVGVDPNHDLSYGDQSARRKRSKISRACDECRRKKVRCDASTETGVETCSNCRRLAVTCQFSRVPMKRGPSKGYIKELAERLHSLENQVHPGMINSEMQYQPMGEMSPPRAYQEFESPVDPPTSRKRTFSVFDGLPSSSFGQLYNARGSQNAFDTQGATADHNQAAIDNANMAANLFWHTNEHELPPGVAVEDESKEEDMTPLGVDDGAFDAYHARIHKILPILPHSKERLLVLLHQCPREVQEIFLYALYKVTHTNLERVRNTFEKVVSVDNAQDLLLVHTRSSPVMPLTAANIVLFQSIMLMILDADTRGPDNLTLKDGIPKHTLITFASRFGYDLIKSSGQTSRTPSEADADANLVRRNWVSLVVLSRWCAISISDASLMRYEEITPEDYKLMGPAFKVVDSYSSFLIDLIPLITENYSINQAKAGVGRLIGNNLIGALERLNRIDAELLNSVPGERPEQTSDRNNLENLAATFYWTIRLLIKRHIFVNSPYEIIHCAKELANELYAAIGHLRPQTPFELHCIALCTMTLLEATVLPEYASDCWDSLKRIESVISFRDFHAESNEFQDILLTPAWDDKFRLFMEWRRTKAQESQLHDPAAQHRRTSSAAAAAPMGANQQRSLQHLADLAVGAEEGSVSSPPPENASASPKLGPAQAQQGKTVVDFTLLTQKGYLNVFSGLIYSRKK